MPEVRRLVLAMAEHDEHRAFRFGWSVWRRAHQAVAARCAAARRACTAERPRPCERASPPATPQVGRPRHDHRTVLGGILWVVRTRASWRDLPPECGKWETAYKRYRLWHDTGLWPKLLAALDRQTSTQPSEVAL